MAKRRPYYKARNAARRKAAEGMERRVRELEERLRQKRNPQPDKDPEHEDD